MTRKPRRCTAVVCGGALGLLGIARAQAPLNGPGAGIGQLNDWSLAPAQLTQPYTYGIDAGVGETDNVNLAPANKVSQTIATADADFTVHEQSRLLDVNALGNFSYLDYLQGAFSPQLIGRFDGIGNLAIVPGHLIWTLKEDFGQAPVNPYAPVTPANLENVNYVTTGPDLALRLGALNFLDVSARYARAQYQTSPFNSNRLLGSISLGRDVSAAAAVSLNATTERVLFDNTTLNTDFERSSGFGRFEAHGARTDLIAELGVTVVRQTGAVPESTTGTGTGAPIGLAPTIPVNAVDSTTGPLAKLELSRKVSPSARIFLTAGRDLTDASSSFAAQNTNVGITTTLTPAALTADSYRTTYASAGWQYARNRTKITLTGRWEKDIYPGLAPLDVTLPSATLTVDRRLTRNLSAELLGSWTKNQYPNAVLAPGTIGSTDYANGVVGASLTWHHGRGLEIKLRCSHNSYDASNGNTGYQETRAFLTIGYRPLLVPAAEDVEEPGP